MDTLKDIFKQHSWFYLLQLAFSFHWIYLDCHIYPKKTFYKYCTSHKRAAGTVYTDFTSCESTEYSTEYSFSSAIKIKNIIIIIST